MKHVGLAALLALVSLVLARPSWADTLFLKNGCTFEGKITDCGDQYEVRMASGTIRFDKSAVERVETGAVGTSGWTQSSSNRDEIDSSSRESLRQESHEQQSQSDDRTDPAKANESKLESLERAYNLNLARANAENQHAMVQTRAIVDASDKERFAKASSLVRWMVLNEPFLKEKARQSGLLRTLRGGFDEDEETRKLAESAQVPQQAERDRAFVADEASLRDEIATASPSEAKRLVLYYKVATRVVTSGDPAQFWRASADVRDMILSRPTLRQVAEANGLLQAIEAGRGR